MKMVTLFLADGSEVKRSVGFVRSYGIKGKDPRVDLVSVTYTEFDDTTEAQLKTEE